MGVWGLTEKELGISIERWDMKIRYKWISEFGVKYDYSEKQPVVIRKWKWCPTALHSGFLFCFMLCFSKFSKFSEE